jgi:hypothetical protein
MRNFTLARTHRENYPQHYTEWLNSKVDPEIINLNVQPLSLTTPYEYLLYGLPESERRNDGRLRDYWLEKYRHVESGGWWCSGIDLLTGEDSLWGGFKPYSPRSEKKPSGFGQPPKTKVIKYEHPPKVPTEIFALKVPQHIWDLIASRIGLKRYHSPLALRLTARRKPITFWEWILKNPQIPIVITEGAKKAGAILTAGYVVLALPGIFNGYRQLKNQFGKPIGRAKLIPQLEILAKAGREFIFAFDCDSQPKTVAAVRKAILKTGNLLQQKGCSVSVITWNYPDKGVDDLIAARGVDCFHALYQNRISLSKFQLLELLDLSPYVSSWVNQRYLGTEDNDALFKDQENFSTSLEERDWGSGQEIPPNSQDCSRFPFIPPDDAQIIGISSPKGTGKTEWLAHQVEKALYSGQPVLNLTHRDLLGREQAERLGIEYRTELTSLGRLLGYSLCVDSLHPNANPRFNPDNWHGAIVVIDEVEQVIWHLLNSDTCASFRVAILDAFKELLQTVVSTNGKIYLSDADLSPIALKYIQQLIGFPVKTWVVKNTYLPNQGKRKLYVYDGHDPRELVSSLVKAISKRERPIIHTSAQKAESQWGTLTLEAYFKERFPHLSILRIDSESVSDPEHPAYGCMGSLNEILPLYDLVIASPTIETGVSIDIKHFTGVWGIATGVQTVDAVCQTLERVRDDVPRHLWAKKYSSSCVGNGSTSIKALLKSQDLKTKANLWLLQQGGIDEFDDLDINPQQESLWTWAKRAILVNTGMKRYRESILDKLKSEGYELKEVLVDSEEIKRLKLEMKMVKTMSYERHRIDVSNSESLTNSELEKLEKKRSKTRSERLQEQKGKLMRRYATDDVSPELVKKDDDGWYPKLRLHYFLTVGKIYLLERDRRSLSKMKENGNGKVWKPDVNSRQLSAEIETLKLINIEQFFDQTREFTSDSLKEWLEQLILWRHDLKTVLGMSINPERDTPIAVAQRLLGLLGLKMECIGQRGGRSEKRPRVYRGCNINPDDRQAIFERWLERDAKKYCDGSVHTLSNNI